MTGLMAAILGIFIFGGVIAMLVGAADYSAAPSIMQQIGGVLEVGFGSLVVSVCVGAGYIGSTIKKSE